MPSSSLRPWWALIILFLVETLITVFGVGMGLTKEANPFLPSNVWALAGIRIIFLAVGAWVLLLAWDRNPVFMGKATMTLNVGLAGLCVWDLGVLTHELAFMANN